MRRVLKSKQFGSQYLENTFIELYYVTLSMLTAWEDPAITQIITVLEVERI